MCSNCRKTALKLVQSKLREKGYDAYDRETVALIVACALDSIVPCSKCPTVDKRGKHVRS